MDKVKRFLQTTIVYLLGSVLSKLVTFFMLPLYTNKILPEQYGTYDLVIAFINLIAPIAFFQIWDGMFRRSFDFDKKEEKYNIICNAFFVCIIGSFLYVIVFSVLQKIYSFEHFGWAVLYGFFFSMHYFYGYICRVFLDNKLFVFSGVINTFITAICNVIFIVGFNMGVKSLYIAPVIGILIQSIIIEKRFKIFNHFNLNVLKRDEIFRMMKFSIPLCVAAVSYWLLSGFTKVIITSLLGTFENGIYAVANRFSMMITLVVTIFQYSWNEIAYLMLEDENRIKSYNMCIDILLKFVTLGGAIICIFIKIIFPYFIGTQYSMAINIIPATIIGSMMNSMAGFVGTLFMTENKTNDVMKSTLIAASVNVILGFILTKYFGLHGATISLAIAFSVLLIIRLYQAKIKINLYISIKNIIFITIPLIFSIVVYYIFNSIILDIFTILLMIIFAIVSMKDYILLLIEQFMNNKNAKKNNV